MLVDVIVASIDLRDAMWPLFQEYCADLSQYDGEKRPKTRKHYPYFDRYWEDEECVPFLVIYHHEPVGFCFVRDIGVSYRIDDFYIRPLHRRRGFGTVVVNYVKDYCRNLGRHNTMAANVYVNNDPAIRFWQSVGFRDTGRRTRVKNLRMIETEADLEEIEQE